MGPGTKLLTTRRLRPGGRNWEDEITYDLEDEIVLNSDLEVEIEIIPNSDLEDEIEPQFEPGG